MHMLGVAECAAVVWILFFSSVTCERSWIQQERPKPTKKV